MLFYYGVDLVQVVEGSGPPPSLVLELIEGLPDDSMFHALRLGGPQFLGWGVDRHIRASTYDAINVNTTATGNWKKSPPKPEPFPRPKTKQASKKKATVADLYERLKGKLGR